MGRLDGLSRPEEDMTEELILPDEPVAHEGRVGVIRARTSETIEAVKGLQP